MLREHVKKNSELGQLVKSFMDKGALVSDGLILMMVKDRIMQPDCNNGFLFDGFPRTVVQAEMLDLMLDAHDFKLDVVVELQLDDDTIVHRALTRRVCTQCRTTYNVEYKPTRVEGVCDACKGAVVLRADDHEETVRQRLKIFYEQTTPVVDYYREKGLLVEANMNDATAGEDAVLQAILKKLSGIWKPISESFVDVGPNIVFEVQMKDGSVKRAFYDQDSSRTALMVRGTGGSYWRSLVDCPVSYRRIVE